MGRPVVFIHGMWCTGGNFVRLADALRPRGHDCFTPSLPLHEVGREDPAVGRLSLEDYAAHIEAYVHAQNFPEPPILVGHSVGGLIAQKLAARLKPFALVLLTPAAPAGIFPIRLSVLAAFFTAFLKWGWWYKPQKPSFARAQTSAFNGVPAEKHRALYATLVPESGRLMLEAALPQLDPRKAAHVDPAGVICPVYVVSCGQDRLTPAAVVRKVAARYNASLRHYPDRGHWVLDDVETDEMAAEIANWLQAHEHRAAARGRG